MCGGKIKLFYRYINTQVWSKGRTHFSKALSKGPKTTTWIWNLHSDAHDFHIQHLAFVAVSSNTSQQNNRFTRRAAVLRLVAVCSSGMISSMNIKRSAFSSNLAHLSLVFFWITGMHFHGAYFSNYDIWLKDPKHYLPSAHLVWSLIGQHILNSDIGNYFQGIHITSGIFSIWRGGGLFTQIHLKYGCTTSLLGTIISLAASYFRMSCFFITRFADSSGFYKKFKSILPHHLSVLFGLSSISWSGHQIHICVPPNRLLDSGIDPVVIPCPQDLLFKDFNWGTGCGWAFGLWLQLALLSDISGHHFYLGIVFITSGLSAYGYFTLGNGVRVGVALGQGSTKAVIINSWDAQLSMNLGIAASLSIAFAHHIYAIPIYPYCASDYPTVLCLFYHHMWVAALFTVGAAAHASIFIIGDWANLTSLTITSWACIGKVLNHRDVIIGHLIWATLALGLHSFGVYIHNDTLQALGRREDIFKDNSIQLKPLFAKDRITHETMYHYNLSSDIKIYVVDKKVPNMSHEMGRADFIVTHIHAFTIHVALLILSKGILYARNSRLVSDKFQLGFRYPCDGPGRGGTCQISPWDHIYLAVFWMYNSVSVVLFHYFWKMQSDVWCSITNLRASSKPPAIITHICSGDFSVNSSTINGWLRNFLWSEAAQVIQSYGTNISGYGFIFISGHFIWAFSLMFLYSGRGYWQELIESILWGHHKLKIMPHIQPRALSISQGRAVGFIHYTLGGVGCTWAFFISRMVVLSS